MISSEVVKNSEVRMMQNSNISYIDWGSPNMRFRGSKLLENGIINIGSQTSSSNRIREKSAPLDPNPQSIARCFAHGLFQQSIYIRPDASLRDFPGPKRAPFHPHVLPGETPSSIFDSWFCAPLGLGSDLFPANAFMNVSCKLIDSDNGLVSSTMMSIRDFDDSNLRHLDLLVILFIWNAELRRMTKI